MHKFPIITAFLALMFCSLSAIAQTSWVLNPLSERYYPAGSSLRRDVENLCDTLMHGRGRGSAGHTDATAYLMRRFEQEGLKPINGLYVKGFPVGKDGSAGHNVVGMLEGTRRDFNRSYIVVSAHYDHLGIIKGQLYPGADANASGVAAMLAVAHSLRGQRELGFQYGTNIIFVAFDAYMDGRAGSKAFLRSVDKGELVDPFSGNVISRDQIKMMVDLDQVGSTLAPVEMTKRNYLIAIGPELMHGADRMILKRCNSLYGSNLALYHSYYGSERFTRMFYELGDRKHFLKAGIPVMYFTSGITDLTNTVADKPSSLDYSILSRRALLIFRFVEKMM